MRHKSPITLANPFQVLQSGGSQPMSTGRGVKPVVLNSKKPLISS
jgi:hypothetical protein